MFAVSTHLKITCYSMSNWRSFSHINAKLFSLAMGGFCKPKPNHPEQKWSPLGRPLRMLNNKIQHCLKQNGPNFQILLEWEWLIKIQNLEYRSHLFLFVTCKWRNFPMLRCAWWLMLKNCRVLQIQSLLTQPQTATFTILVLNHVFHELKTRCQGAILLFWTTLHGVRASYPMPWTTSASLYIQSQIWTCHETTHTKNDAQLNKRAKVPFCHQGH